MKRALLALALAALAAAPAAAASTDGAGATVTGGSLYKVSLEADATLDATGSAPAFPTLPFNASTLKATWSIKTEPTNIWLANFNGPVGESLVTKASASDNRGGTGTVHADEAFTWYQHNAPQTPLSGSSSCDAKVQNELAVTFKADSTKGGVGIEVDFGGGVRTTGGAVVPCDNSPAERGVDGQPDTKDSVFDLMLDPEAKTEPYLQMVATLQRFQIGMKSIGPILTNASRVTDAPSCKNLDLTECDVTFTLSGSLKLEKVCGGSVTIAGVGECTGGGGTGTSKKPPKSGGPKSPPSAKPPVITGLKVTPHSIHARGSAVITYHDNEPGTTTVLEVTHGTVAGVPLPVAVVKHVDATASVSVPLPASPSGKPFDAGTYQIVAMPFNSKTGKGKTVTATFVIAP